ncbi:STAS domain-containing protein [Streptomyces sp. YC504]|uniref:Anti-sigma factor antagonist n=1 Tax=Streptomyces mesophilus TaxID=1775132 RepID=A0A6G4XH23_9ACTN|nr:STAS domain-containing protein [Streptomyces mesophilus]NGO76482.1 STAS domain-containing protein [Streptomyces mesophilus]
MSGRAGLQVTVAWREPVLTVRAVGALDFDTGEDFSRWTSEALADHPGARTLCVDCAGLDHVDSTGLSVLLMLRRRLRTTDVELRLAHRNTALQRLLEITGTLDHLTDVPDDGTAAPTRSADTPEASYADNSGHGPAS